MTIISIHSVPRSGSSWLLSIFDSLERTKCVYQPLFSYAFKNQIDENSTGKDFKNFTIELRKTDDDFCCMKTNYHNNGKNDILTFHKNDSNHVVMKHVTHHYLIEKFIEFNKDIKIIGLIRSPENVIESQMKAKHECLKDWLNGTDKNKDFKECYFGFNKWLELNNYFITLKEKYPENVILIKYEDLLKNTKIEIEKLFHFCNIKLEESTIDFIKKSSSKNDNYDYSVFRNKIKLIDKKCQLDKEIINHIKKRTFKLAIFVNLNILTKEDVKLIGQCENKPNKIMNKENLKKNFDYLYQFLFLYESIKIHLKDIDYTIYVLTTRPHTIIANKLKELGVIMLTKPCDHPLYNRPQSYIMDVKCDYRLIMDADTLFCNEFTADIIDQIKEKDALGMYGHRNINYDFYNKICNQLEIKIPKEIEETKQYLNNKHWTTRNSYLYNDKNYNTNERLFPYFNNGAIIVKNEFSKKIGLLWKELRDKLTKFGYFNKGPNGELSIGLAINHITKNWGPLPKGFNLVLSCETKDRYRNLKVETEFGVKPILIHWQSLSMNDEVYKKYVKNIINDKVIQKYLPFRYPSE